LLTIEIDRDVKRAVFQITEHVFLSYWCRYKFILIIIYI
jgi:hypothetical protein